MDGESERVLENERGVRYLGLVALLLRLRRGMETARLLSREERVEVDAASPARNVREHDAILTADSKPSYRCQSASSQ